MTDFNLNVTGIDALVESINHLADAIIQANNRTVSEGNNENSYEEVYMPEATTADAVDADTIATGPMSGPAPEPVKNWTKDQLTNEALALMDMGQQEKLCQILSDCGYSSIPEIKTQEGINLVMNAFLALREGK